MNSSLLIFLVGPTAVGKSDVALFLSRSCRGEIVSCDSMQVYREISVASNKPSDRELNLVPHHLVNILSVRDVFDVATFNDLALKAVHDILGRGKACIVVGGSGMYMQVLLDGIFEGGAKDEHVRKILQERAEREGLQVLYNELAEIDPQAARRVHPNDRRRIVRALEVYQTAHKPISELRQERAGLWQSHRVHAFVLNRKREELYDIINQRVDRMFEQGLVEEIRGLGSIKLSLTAERIIGVQEVQGYLSGEYDLQQAKEIMKMNTRRLAKRQLTWFRKEKRLVGINVEDNESPEEISRRILLQINNGKER